MGKYNGLSDAYLSVIKALQHACIKCKSRLKVRLAPPMVAQQRRALQRIRDDSCSARAYLLERREQRCTHKIILLRCA